MQKLITLRDVNGVPYLLTQMPQDSLSDVVRLAERFFGTEIRVIEDICIIQ